MKPLIDSIIKQEFKVDDDFELTKGTHLYKDLGGDSFNILHLVTLLEDSLKCVILDEEWQHWSYVGNIYKYFNVFAEE